MTNLLQHSLKAARNAFHPHFVGKHFVFALGVLRILGIVSDGIWYTVREFRDSGCHETTNVV